MGGHYYQTDVILNSVFSAVLDNEWVLHMELGTRNSELGQLYLTVEKHMIHCNTVSIDSDAGVWISSIIPYVK